MRGRGAAENRRRQNDHTVISTVHGITKATLIRMMVSVPLLEALWDDELEFIARGAAVQQCPVGQILLEHHVR